MKIYTIDFQLDPLHMYKQNAAERAIIACNNHFISEITITDPYFLISKWYRLLPQCLITLNLLFNSRVNPALSAHAYLCGIYDFNNPLWRPLEPPRKFTKKLATIDHGEIMAHPFVILVHHLTTINVCGVTFPQLVYLESQIHYNISQRHLISQKAQKIISDNQLETKLQI